MSVENVEAFTFREIAATDNNLISEEIMSLLYSGINCCHLV
jgi:hypothetical protein